MKPTPEESARAEALQALLREASLRYYVQDQPTLSDGEYDRLFRELELLEKRFPSLRAPESPTQRVGAPPSEAFKKVRHQVPMLSLGNVFDPAELRAFDQKIHRILNQIGRAHV